MYPSRSLRWCGVNHGRACRPHSCQVLHPLQITEQSWRCPRSRASSDRTLVELCHVLARLEAAGSRNHRPAPAFCRLASLTKASQSAADGLSSGQPFGGNAVSCSGKYFHYTELNGNQIGISRFLTVKLSSNMPLNQLPKVQSAHQITQETTVRRHDIAEYSWPSNLHCAPGEKSLASLFGPWRCWLWRSPFERRPLQYKRRVNDMGSRSTLAVQRPRSCRARRVLGRRVCVCIQPRWSSLHSFIAAGAAISRGGRFSSFFSVASSDRVPTLPQESNA